MLVRISGRGDAALTGINVYVRFNGDAGGNYSQQYLSATSSASVSALGTVGVTQVTAGGLAAASSPANYAGYLEVCVANYTGTTFYKAGVAQSYVANTALAGGQQVGPTGFQWLNGTGAINRVTILPSSGNFIAGSRVTIYGLA